MIRVLDIRLPDGNVTTIPYDNFHQGVHEPTNRIVYEMTQAQVDELMGKKVVPAEDLRDPEEAGLKPFVCETCEKAFKSPAGLGKHVKTCVVDTEPSEEDNQE